MQKPLPFKFKLKQIEVQGDPLLPTPVKLAYLVLGNEIFFTATEDNDISTMALARKIVSSICQAEDITQEGHEFYDVQTLWMYHEHPDKSEKDWYQIMHLVFDGEYGLQWHCVKTLPHLDTFICEEEITHKVDIAVDVFQPYIRTP
jgi:hypothetical protein